MRACKLGSLEGGMAREMLRTETQPCRGHNALWRTNGSGFKLREKKEQDESSLGTCGKRLLAAQLSQYDGLGAAERH